MKIINTLLSLLFALLMGLILVFGLIVMVCILLFSTRLTGTLGKTKMVTVFEKAAMVTEFVKPVPVTKPEAAHLVIELDKAELLAKLAKEIAPNYSMTWTGVSVKVDATDNTWNAKANMQVKSAAQEYVSLEEESLIFNCRQLNNSCTVTSCNIQNEPTTQHLELSDIVRVFLEMFCGTLQMPSAVGSADTNKSSKTKEAELYQGSEE